MRDVLAQELCNLARKDKNVWLVTADLGFMVFEKFIKEFPNQYLNIGVSEQNMIGVAAGLALAGKKVFVYSISTFSSMRCYEQIRNDLCFNKLPVCVIGSGSAFSYGKDGYTHFPLEDIGIMRLLPNMTVLSPADPYELKHLIHQIYDLPGPSYIRIAKRGEPIIHKQNDKIKIGSAAIILKGKDILFLVSGRQLPNVIEVVKKLKEKKINSSVISCHTLKPFDFKTIIKELKNKKLVITCEEHFITGGLYTIVAENFINAGIKIPLIPVGIKNKYPEKAGSQEYHLENNNLTVNKIIKIVIKNFSKNKLSGGKNKIK